MLSPRSRFFALILASSMAGAIVGCGDSASPSANSKPDRNNQIAADPPALSQPANPPTDVVRQFLDLVRRGGQTEQATGLLTAKAQSELKRIGRSVQPIGSPDAQFNVTRFERVPSDDPTSESAALVHSLWTEPDEVGTEEPVQVVWAVQTESDQWKISGLAMEIEVDQEPIVINFEDGDRMAAILASTETNEANSSKQPNDPTSQAAVNDAVLSR